MTFYEWLRQIGVEREELLVVNLVTAGFRPGKGKLVGAVVRSLAQPPELLLEAGCTQEQIETLHPYSGVGWEFYSANALLPSRAQRKLIDILQAHKHSAVVSYSVHRFLQPWLLDTSWLQPLLEYPTLDFQDLVAGVDSKAVLNYFRAQDLGEFSEWLHSAAPGNARGYGMEALLQRFGCGAVAPREERACIQRNQELAYAFMQLAGMPVC